MLQEVWDGEDTEDTEDTMRRKIHSLMVTAHMTHPAGGDQPSILTLAMALETTHHGTESITDMMPDSCPTDIDQVPTLKLIPHWVTTKTHGSDMLGLNNHCVISRSQ